LTCFTGTIAVGLANGNGWPSILSSALLVCLIALVVGMVVGSIMLRCVNEQIQRHREENPIPDEEMIGESDPAQAGAN